MRELKFRIWDGNNQIFAYPTTLELDCGLEYQQYTGLKDKNGREIYEGDIFNLFGRDGQTVVSPNNILKLDDFLGGDYWIKNSAGGYTPIYEVIGNVYENPELLEV